MLAQCRTNVLWVSERRDGWQGSTFSLRQNICAFKMNLNFKGFFYLLLLGLDFILWVIALLRYFETLLFKARWSTVFGMKNMQLKFQALNLKSIKFNDFFETQRVCPSRIFILQIPDFREMLYYVILCTIPHRQASTPRTSIDINIDI